MKRVSASARSLKLSSAALACACAASCTTLAPTSARSPAAIVSETLAQGCDALKSQTHATIVIFAPAIGRRLVCNPLRAGARFVPASTYKIPHTLIALETGAVASIDTRFPWDGEDRGVAAWNRDLALGEAVAASAVWVFQDIAARIGHDVEAAWIDRLDYGNAIVGNATDLRHFWLSGPTAISASEQIDFLIRLRGRALPVSEAATAQTIAALRLGETAQGYIVYGKTGAMLPIDDRGFLRSGNAEWLPQGLERTGWFVGWIERPAASGGPVFFAHNLDLALPGAMAARTADAFAMLRANGFPAPQ